MEPIPDSPPAVLIASPCAACKVLRRRCADNCVLAPYFPPTNPLKFTAAHRIFGASNIIRLLQDLHESQRADAVSSLVYEANARNRDPVYGCAGIICQLQKLVGELQAEVARAKAELTAARAQNAGLLAAICMSVAATAPPPPSGEALLFDAADGADCFLEDCSMGSLCWETCSGHDLIVSCNEDYIQL